MSLGVLFFRPLATEPIQSNNAEPSELPPIDECGCECDVPLLVAMLVLSLSLASAALCASGDAAVAAAAAADAPCSDPVDLRAPANGA